MDEPCLRNLRSLIWTSFKEILIRERKSLKFTHCVVPQNESVKIFELRKWSHNQQITVPVYIYNLFVQRIIHF
jgi:hypothetical protein